jgi:hypothetical protein
MRLNQRFGPVYADLTATFTAVSNPVPNRHAVSPRLAAGHEFCDHHPRSLFHLLNNQERFSIIPGKLADFFSRRRNHQQSGPGEIHAQLH